MGEMFSGTKGKLVLIACALFVFQQFSGINAIVYFSSKVFRDAGVGSETLASAAVGVVNVVGTVVAASLMDKAGRKCATSAASISMVCRDALVKRAPHVVAATAVPPHQVDERKRRADSC